MLDHNGGFPRELQALVGNYIKVLPGEWRGGKAAGRYGYDPERGVVTLFDTTGANPSSDPDCRGQAYGNY